MTLELRLNNKKEVFELDSDSRKHQHLVKIKIHEDGFLPQVIRVQESSHLRNESLEVSDMTVSIGGYKREYTNLNNDVVILNLAELAETDYLKFFSNEFWVSNDLEQIVVKSADSKKHIDWAKRQVVEGFNVEDEDYIRLRAGFMSPSQEKKNEITCLRWNGDTEEYEAVLDSMTDNAYSLFKDGKDLSYGQLVKAGARLAQGLSPSADMKSYDLNSVAILLSKDKREFADGGGFFTSKPGYPVGLGAQLRSFATDKWFGLCIDKRSMAGMTERYGEVIYVDKEIAEGRVTKEQAQEYIVAAFGRDNRGPWAEHTVVLGKQYGTPDMYIDLNIVKAPMNFLELLPTSLKILDLAGPVQGNKVVFGSQMLFSTLLSKEGEELMSELLLETIADSIVPGSVEAVEEVKELGQLLKAMRLESEEGVREIQKAREEELTSSILDKFYNKPARVPSFEDFESSMNYSSGLIDMINPLWARSMDQGTKRSIEKALANKMSGVLSEFQPEVEGKFCRVLADFSTEFGLTLLEDNEVCAPDLPAREVVGIRSPKGGIKEQGVYTNVTVKEMLVRINNSNLGKRDKVTLSGLYKALKKKSHVALVPSSDAVKLLHSGMDFDFDGVTFITDVRVVDLFKQFSPVVVKVTDEGGKQSKDKYKFDADHMATLIEKQFNNGNLPVGIVCNHNHTWVMLLSDLKLARKVLTHLNGSGENTEYEGLEYNSISHNRLIVEISGDKTRELLEELKGLDFSSLDDATIVRIIEDINVMMNRYIQVTIDASKSGEVVNIPESLLINDEVLAASLTAVEFDLYRRRPAKGFLNVVEEKLAVKIMRSVTTMNQVEVGRSNKFIFNDLYHRTRTDVARVATKLLACLVSRDAELDEETTLMRDRVKYDNKTFLHFRQIFNDVNASRRDAIGRSADEEVADINTDFRDTLTYLANSIRIATPNMTVEERVLAAIDIATDKTSNINAAASMFPSATLAWEYILLCSNHASGLKFIGNPIYKGDSLADGDEIEVINNSITQGGASEVEDGIYTVREHDGRLYATKSIKDLVTPMITADNKLVIRLNSGQDFEAISEDISGKAIEILDYRSSAIKKDTINNKHRIDLPSGRSDYSKLINGSISKSVKEVISVTQTVREITIKQMFLCLEIESRKEVKISNNKSLIVERPTSKKTISVMPKEEVSTSSLEAPVEPTRVRGISAKSERTIQLDVATETNTVQNNIVTEKPKATRGITFKGERTIDLGLAPETPRVEEIQSVDKDMLAIAKQAREAYEGLSTEEKAVFPTTKLEKLEAIEKELGINSEKINDAMSFFNLL